MLGGLVRFSEGGVLAAARLPRDRRLLYRVGASQRTGLVRRSGGQALPELRHGLTDRARQLRELLGAEEKDSERKRDPEILWS
jgi:hypothetical protein